MDARPLAGGRRQSPCFCVLLRGVGVQVDIDPESFRMRGDSPVRCGPRVINATHHAPRYPRISQSREFALSIFSDLNDHQLTAKGGRIRKGNPGDRDQPGAGPHRWTGESRVEAWCPVELLETANRSDVERKLSRPMLPMNGGTTVRWALLEPQGLKQW